MELVYAGGQPDRQREEEEQMNQKGRSRGGGKGVRSGGEQERRNVHIDI